CLTLLYFCVILIFSLLFYLFFFFFLFVVFFFFFFFSSRRRHTRWPRDWSSDVCSSDLKVIPPGRSVPAEMIAGWNVPSPLPRNRSEERRVGKECRSRWSPDH